MFSETGHFNQPLLYIVLGWGRLQIVTTYLSEQ